MENQEKEKAARLAAFQDHLKQLKAEKTSDATLASIAPDELTGEDETVWEDLKGRLVAAHTALLELQSGLSASDVKKCEQAVEKLRQVELELKGLRTQVKAGKARVGESQARGAFYSWMNNRLAVLTSIDYVVSGWDGAVDSFAQNVPDLADIVEEIRVECEQAGVEGGG